MRLPIHPPVSPMLAKRVDALPDGRGLDLRAQVGRLSRARLPRRRRDARSRAATRSRSTATSPSWCDARARSCRERCVLDGEIVIAGPSGLDFEALQLRIHPAASRVKLLAERDAGVGRLLGSAVRSASGTCATEPFARAPRASSRRCSPARAPPIHLTPATTRSRRRRGLVPPLRRRRARRRHGQARGRRLRAEQARDAEGEARARLRLRRRRLSLAQGRRGRRRRLAAARPLRRRRDAPSRRRRGELHGGRSGASS